MKINIFVRHSNSQASPTSHRPNWFSKEKCWGNLNKTKEDASLTVLFDGDQHPFLKNVVKIDGGSESKSFLNMLEYVNSLAIPDDEIIYFLEDDYLHRAGWVSALREGFGLPVDYITLYDHRDKYFFPMYSKTQCQLFHTESVHWRTTISTTNSYAMLAKTFRKHYDIHKQFSENTTYSKDHDKFVKLWKVGSNLISSVPGYSTHCEINYLSPTIDWETISLSA